MRNILLAATLILALAASTSAQSIQSPMDATAARKDLSNVDPATGRTALDAEQAGVAAAHVASTGTDVHGLGTMATEAKTNYVATDTFTGHTGNTSNPHSVTYSQLSDKPTFGTMASETAADYLKVADAKGFETLALDATGNATFSYSFDVATLTVGGVDVLGDVHSALTAILGE